MDDVLSEIEGYNRNRKRKVLITFDDMISHVMSDNFSAQQILKDLFIRCRKLNISLCCTKELFNFLTIDTIKDKKFIKNFDVTL